MKTKTLAAVKNKMQLSLAVATLCHIIGRDNEEQLPPPMVDYFSWDSRVKRQSIEMKVGPVQDLGMGILKDFSLTFDFPCLSVVKDPNSCLAGCTYRMTEKQFNFLVKLEGIDPSQGKVELSGVEKTVSFFSKRPLFFFVNESVLLCKL